MTNHGFTRIPLARGRAGLRRVPTLKAATQAPDKIDRSHEQALVRGSVPLTKSLLTTRRLEVSALGATACGGLTPTESWGP